MRIPTSMGQFYLEIKPMRQGSPTNREASKDTADEKHGDVRRTTLQSTTENGNGGCNHKRHFASKSVTSPPDEDSSQEAAHTETRVHRTDDSVGVRISIGILLVLGEIEIVEPALLAKSGRCNAKCISIGQTA